MKVFLGNGDTMQVSNREYWRRNGAMQKRIQATSFMRIGDYHLALGCQDLASYFEATPNIQRSWEVDYSEEPEFRQSAKRDRLRQCSEIETALNRFPSHPHAEGIRAAIAAERAGWAKTAK